MTQQDLFGARVARDAALKTVEGTAESGFDRARGLISRLPPNWEGTGEDMRLHIEFMIGSPHHHNAYGALVSQAVRRGYLKKTGRYAQMKTKKSHARETPVYVRSYG